MIQIENTWLQGKVVPNLNVQILYFDQPYLPEGADQEMVEKWLSEDSKEGTNIEKELTTTPSPKIISTEPYVILECKDQNAKIYCFFNFSIRGIRYTRSQEFTDLYNSAQMVLAYAYGPKGVSKTVKLK
jgi:hypothetical protein